MEDKRRDAGTLPAAGSSAATEVPAAEPASSRRRAGSQKRKANNLNASNSSSTPSKRITREKVQVAHPPIHNGPLTRARQGPNNHGSGSGSAGLANFSGRAKREELGAVSEGGEHAAALEASKMSEKWEALEAKFEAEFDAIRSRDSNAHVVPSHCGWFSWTKVHALEERTMPSFFNGKSPTRTPDTYMEIRNWIMKKFQANPNTLIELKDLSELEVADLEARQEVLEFLDYWGLINFHPFPTVDSTVDSVGGDGAAKKDSMLEILYHFEAIQSCPPALPKPKPATPAVPSRLFSESAIADELVRPEGPSVEYHCNSCAADCSRKRYHCQKQADFDLCSDCFNNGKFGSNMSSSDFILMEPAEAPGLSGGKWTDQETLLLLEALELYKENWNEIAEHVATKTKAQCILHFVQMPIEDSFLDCEDDVDASSREMANLAAPSGDLAIPKDVPETNEGKTADDKDEPSPMEISEPQDASEVKVCQETLNAEDAIEVKDDQQALKSKETSEVKVDQMVENCALKALKEAFEAVGYSPTPENPLSFAEMGNPVMALAVFLTRLVGPDVAIASARSSLKSISGDSPGMQLAARHCYLLEDPPDDKKESSAAEMADDVAQKDENQENKNHIEEKPPSVSNDKDLTNDQGDKKNEDSVSVPLEKRPMLSSDGDSLAEPEKDSGAVAANKEIDPGILNESDALASKVTVSPARESEDGIPGSQPGEPIEAAKNIDMSSGSVPPEKNGPNHSVTSTVNGEPSQPTGAAKDAKAVSDSPHMEKSEPHQPVISSSIGEPAKIEETKKDENVMTDSVPKNTNVSEQPITDALVENGPPTGEDRSEHNKKEKNDSTESKDEPEIAKLKRAAVATLSAAAVKAKLLAKQEEDQVQQLATLLVEKQLHKLETKLAFFNEMDNVIFRVREQLERSRQRLYHERAQIIAARLGLPASASRTMPPSALIAMHFANANAMPRPPLNMTSPRPPLSRPMGMISPSSNPFVSTTPAGTSIRPSSQETLHRPGQSSL